jgi:hypothetical protein
MRAPNVIVLGIIGGETQPIKPGDVEFILAGVLLPGYVHPAIRK